VTSPYRDENETLRAENDRLRAEIHAHRSRSHGARLALFLLGVDWIATILLRPWFNGSSIALFWGAAAIISLIAILAAASAFDLFRRKPRALSK
jgi:hypothetical protein